MPSNFDFLQPDWAALHDDARQAEQNVFAAPRTCAFYARRAMERMVKWLYDRDADLRKPYQDNLAALIHEPTFRDILPPGLFHQVRLIHKLGNLAVHSDTAINPHDGVQVTRMLHAFLGWAVRAYSRPSPTIAPFDDGLIRRPAAPPADRTAEQLRNLQEQLAAQDAALAAREVALRGTQEEVDQLRRQIAELRAANERALPETDYSEAATRSLFIDVMLREAEWDPNGADAREYPVVGMPNESGEGFVDNVLWGLDRLPLGLLETKRTKVSPANGKQQAKLYADCLEQMTGQRPIIYYSNGYETWMWDDLNYPPRQVQGFYKRDELQLLINRRTSRQPIDTAPINQQIIDRPYHYEEEFYDEETGTMPVEIDSAALNQWLFNEDTVDKILAVLMERGLKIQGGDKLGKTIIFAANHDHAEFIVERFDANYPHLKGKFCRLIDNQVRYAQSLIDDFYVADKDPQIAVSVDMLDTGIDVPECVNLVFFKRVRSKTKFWQMIGRGTRLCPNLFGPGQDKDCFYVFDCCENLEFFGENPEGYESRAVEPVKQRIFRRRLNLVDRIGRLPERDAALDAALDALRDELLDIMHQDVTRMNPDNFVVRSHRRQVEKYARRDAWNQLGPSEMVEIGEHLTGLPTPDDDDEFARRFDLLILNLQLSILEGTREQGRYAQQVRDLAQGLVEKRTIPAVKERLELILELQSDDFWDGVTLPMLENVRRRLRNLVEFLDQEGGREKVYTDFQDEVGTVTDVPFPGYQVNDFRNYRLKVERFVREHQTHVTIHRLKHNQPITSADIAALESILFSEGGPCSRVEFVATYGTDTPLGKLIREIVGLERSAAQEAFAEFLTRGNLTADQMTFIGQIIDHLVHNGTMDPAALFGPPFTDFHDHGVVGVLPQDAQAIVRTIQAINNNALVA